MLCSYLPWQLVFIYLFIYLVLLSCCVLYCCNGHIHRKHRLLGWCLLVNVEIKVILIDWLIEGIITRSDLNHFMYFAKRDFSKRGVKTQMDHSLLFFKKIRNVETTPALFRANTLLNGIHTLMYTQVYLLYSYFVFSTSNQASNVTKHSSE